MEITEEKDTVLAAEPKKEPAKMMVLEARASVVPGGIKLFLKSEPIGEFVEALAIGQAKKSRRKNFNTAVEYGISEADPLGMRSYFLMPTSQANFPKFLAYGPSPLNAARVDQTSFLLLDTKLKEGYEIDLSGQFMPRDQIEGILSNLKIAAGDIYKRFISPYQITLNVTVREVS